MKIHSWTRPTLCLPLKTVLKLFACIDLLTAAVLVVLSIWAFVYFENNYVDAVLFLCNPPEGWSLFINLTNADATTINAIIGFCAFYHLQKVVLGFILFFGAVKESAFMIRLWALYTMVLLTIHLLVYLVLLSVGIMQAMTIAVYVAFFTIREYTIWCSSSYINRLTYSLADDESAVGEDDRYYSYKL